MTFSKTVKRSLFLVFLALGTSSAQAITLAPLAGVSFGSGTAHTGQETVSPLLGIEGTYGIAGVLDLGAFFHMNTLSASGGSVGSGEVFFYGGLLRFSTPLVGFFVDGMFGMTQTNFGGASTNSDFAYGFGAGYKFALPGVLSILPRAGYRSLPANTASTSANRTMIDLSLHLVLSIL